MVNVPYLCQPSDMVRYYESNECWRPSTSHILGFHWLGTREYLCPFIGYMEIIHRLGEWIVLPTVLSLGDFTEFRDGIFPMQESSALGDQVVLADVSDCFALPTWKKWKKYFIGGYVFPAKIPVAMHMQISISPASPSWRRSAFQRPLLPKMTWL